MDNIIDFTNCKSGHEKYGGSDSKLSIEYNGAKYMLKFPDERVKRNELETSESNGIFSEYIGSHIFNEIGITAHETILGIYNGEPVVACKDFTDEEYKLHEFKWFMLNMYRKDEIGRIPTYEQIYDVINHHPDLAYIREEAINRYWDEFVVDAFIGNFDRHKENFGYLVSQKTGDIKLAPVYDCGSTLYPALREDKLKEILSNQEMINERVYRFPTAALNISNDRKREEKAKYFDFIASGKDANCTKSLIKVTENIDLRKINTIIENTPMLSDIRIEFYEKMLLYRKEMILDRSLEMLKDKNLLLTGFDADNPITKRASTYGISDTEKLRLYKEDPDAAVNGFIKSGDTIENSELLMELAADYGNKVKELLSDVIDNENVSDYVKSFICEKTDIQMFSDDVTVNHDEELER